MDHGLNGKAAVVTGGSRGIGFAIAETLLAEGAKVMIVARDRGRLDEAAHSLAAAASGRVFTSLADLAQPEELDRYTREVTKALGAVDILVNNAGATPAGRLEDTPDAAWQSGFDLKLMGYVRSARAFLPAMKERGWGRVVNVIGIASHQPMATYVAGGAINAALLNVTKSLAKGYAPFGITVNGVNPGPVDTERWRGLIEQRAKMTGQTVTQVIEQDVGRTPMGRPATVAEVSGMVAFLCSEQAGFVNGALIDIDGAASGRL